MAANLITKEKTKPQKNPAHKVAISISHTKLLNQTNTETRPKGLKSGWKVLSNMPLQDCLFFCGVGLKKEDSIWSKCCRRRVTVWVSCATKAMLPIKGMLSTFRDTAVRHLTILSHFNRSGLWLDFQAIASKQILRGQIVKKIIDSSGGQINDPSLQGNTLLFRSFQQLPCLHLWPLKDFLNWQGALQGGHGLASCIVYVSVKAFDHSLWLFGGLTFGSYFLSKVKGLWVGVLGINNPYFPPNLKQVC